MYFAGKMTVFSFQPAGEIRRSDTLRSFTPRDSLMITVRNDVRNGELQKRRVQEGVLRKRRLFSSSIPSFTFWRGSPSRAKNFYLISGVLALYKGISDFHPFPDTGITRRDINSLPTYSESHNIALVPFDGDNPPGKPAGTYTGDASLISKSLLG
jgi:hypothetical protein